MRNVLPITCWPIHATSSTSAGTISDTSKSSLFCTVKCADALQGAGWHTLRVLCCVCLTATATAIPAAAVGPCIAARCTRTGISTTIFIKLREHGVVALIS